MKAFSVENAFIFLTQIPFLPYNKHIGVRFLSLSDKIKSLFLLKDPILKDLLEFG